VCKDEDQADPDTDVSKQKAQNAYQQQTTEMHNVKVWKESRILKEY